MSDDEEENSDRPSFEGQVDRKADFSDEEDE